MNWKDFIERVEKTDDVCFILNAPVTNETLTRLETFCHATLPEEFKQLYLQGDGIAEKLEVAEIIGYLIFPLQQVKDYNRMLRRWHNNLKKYFFVSDSGYDDYFGYYIEDQQLKSTDIFVWKHEENKIEWVAPSVNVFIEE